MPTIERQGARVAYSVSGDGPAVVLGHSLLCDGRMWSGVEPRLAERCRVVNVDFRGHRGSSAAAPFTLEELAGDVAAILDREGIASAVFVGLSMGGMTALRLALEAPQRVSGMVLLDSNGDREAPSRRLRYRLMAAAYRRWGLARPLRGAVARLMFGRTTLQRRRELVETLAAWVADHDRAELCRAIHSVFSRGSVLARLGAIRCPVSILVGEEDLATPLDRSLALRSAMPHATLETIPEAGHLSAVERPGFVADRVVGFLEGVPGW